MREGMVIMLNEQYEIGIWQPLGDTGDDLMWRPDDCPTWIYTGINDYIFLHQNLYNPLNYVQRS